MLKKFLYCAIAAVLMTLGCVEAVGLTEEDISAECAVVYCAETGDILFEKNAYLLHSMASTTKIMTSLIALEANTPERVITVTPQMANVEGSSSGLRAGDKLTLRDVVYCMMLESGNEAANTVALSLCGSFEEFAAVMNERAKQIGMHNTSFVTPSGLDDENHYTTAYDMALLAAQALDNADFTHICSSKSYKVNFIDSEKAITLNNHNRLLSEYDGCVGMKTGFTKKSGRCLVSAAEKNGVTIIVVTLNAPNDWDDHKKMLDMGFEAMDSSESNNDLSRFGIRIVGSDKTEIAVSCETCLIPYLKDENTVTERKIYLEKFLYAPVKKGDTVGYAEYISNGKMIKKVPITAAENAELITEQKDKTNFLDRLFGLFDSWWKHGRQ